jgi:LacI family transcriptional regulator, galactose operon repressor
MADGRRRTGQLRPSRGKSAATADGDTPSDRGSTASGADGKPRAARLADIAEVLDLSVTTVSRALNDQPHVDSQTRRRVLGAAERLGYQPNHLARALRSERTFMVGLVLPDIHSDFFATLAAVLQRDLERSGYRLILCITRDDPEVDRHYLLELLHHRVDGIVHVPCTASGAAFVRELNATLPIIEVNRHSESDLFDAFTADDREGARELCTYLRELGHREVAMIAGPEAISTSTDRVAGFRDAFPTASSKVLHGPYSQTAGHDAFAQLVSARKPPSAIFASSNQLVAGALLAAEQLGIGIPEQLSLVGFDEVYWYAISRPPLTTYALPTDELAVLAVQRLVAQMGAPRDAPAPSARPTHARLRGRLIIRGSAAEPAPLSATSSRSPARPSRPRRSKSNGSARGR